MLYHTPDSRHFKNTKAEVWFATEADATAAGFRAPGSAHDTTEEPLALVAVPPGPYGPGSAAPNEDGSGPEGFPIKGNADSMLYHGPESPHYGRTKAEVWFATEADATAAGFSAPGGHHESSAPEPLVTVPPGPYGAGSAAPNEDGSGPEGFPIKGNADSMLYHVPGSRFYDRTKAEVWFATEADATGAGFSAPGGHHN